MQQTLRHEKIEQLERIFRREDVLKGIYYYQSYLRQLRQIGKPSDRIAKYETKVESERTSHEYDVTFSFDREDQVITNYECSCPQFKTTNSCKHLCAVIYNYYDYIFVPLKDDKYKEKETTNLLNLFNSKEERKIKEEIKLEIELNGNNGDTRYPSLELILKIGTSKLYQCKDSKLKKFLETYKNDEEFNFGKNFTYSKESTYFNKENLEIIDYLALINNMNSSNNYYYNNDFIKGDYNIKKILLLLKNKKFILNNYVIEGIKNEFPFKANIVLVDNKYRLTLESNHQNNYIITSDLEYMHLDNNLLKKIFKN